MTESTEYFSFVEAMYLTTFGRRVARRGWTDTGLLRWFVIFVPMSEKVKINEHSPYGRAGLVEVTINSHTDRYDILTSSVEVGWRPDEVDRQTEDWYIV